ncbi:uncharacterized protein LOC110862785 [Folsomia candida]|uniref:Uncharacterized protein n=1 Tax=Folsomia candida TaxID=158441 RepID=A0A226CU12_FOLCA|nr:uncharacterized protein LOC110862785 [Folsomia candida]OXA36922.1 hypothetical protein Fcan01_28307 [Folsomia candida]
MSTIPLSEVVNRFTRTLDQNLITHYYTMLPEVLKTNGNKLSEVRISYQNGEIQWSGYVRELLENWISDQGKIGNTVTIKRLRNALSLIDKEFAKTTLPEADDVRITVDASWKINGGMILVAVIVISLLILWMTGDDY